VAAGTESNVTDQLPVLEFGVVDCCLSGFVFRIVTVMVWLELHDPFTANGGVTVLPLLGE
jgi:hypothetical protein